MDKTKWIIFSILVVAVFGGIIWMNKKDDVKFTGDASKPITENVAIADHQYGAKDAKVVVSEYGDFQCPGCYNMNPTVIKLREQYKDKVTFIFRHFPITSKHPNAFAAATAAEAAGLQGKFYEMSDALYENQKSWQGATVEQRAAVFEGYATGIGLNVEQYKKDLTDPRIAEKINRDRTTAGQLGVNETPSFYINGKRVPSDAALNDGGLSKALDDAVKAAYPDQPPVTKPEGQ